MTDKINIPDEMVQKIQKYIQENRFKDLNEFINQAIKLLVYAEDNKDSFVKILKPENGN